MARPMKRDVGSPDAEPTPVPGLTKPSAAAQPETSHVGPVTPSAAPVATGGRYRPLSDADMTAIHDAVLTVLEDVGFADAIPSCLDALTGAGCSLGPDGRVRFPRALVEATIRIAARKVTLHAQDPAYDCISAAAWSFRNGRGAVHLVDAETRDYRESTARDIYDAARIVERMDNIHFFSGPWSPWMSPTRSTSISNTLYACVAGTSKHVGNVVHGRGIRAAGARHAPSHRRRRGRLPGTPFVSNSNRFVVSPLKFAEDACGVLEACVRGGMPVLLLRSDRRDPRRPPLSQARWSRQSPKFSPGSSTSTPSAPGIPRSSSLAVRLGSRQRHDGWRWTGTGASLCGCAQMARFYDLPGGTAAGMTDAKIPDAQSRFEKGITNAMSALSGSDLVYEAAGMHASLLGFCLESLIIDNDMLGHCLRAARGSTCLPGRSVSKPSPRSASSHPATISNGPKHGI